MFGGGAGVKPGRGGPGGGGAAAAGATAIDSAATATTTMAAVREFTGRFLHRAVDAQTQ